MAAVPTRCGRDPRARGWRPGAGGRGSTERSPAARAPTLMFPDLRTFIDRLRARCRSRHRHRAGRRASGSRRDPPARDRRRRSGAALHQRRGQAFPLVTNLFGTEAPRGAGVRRAPAGAGPPARRAGRRRCCRRTPASCGARATSPAACCRVGLKRRVRGPVTEVVTRTPRLDLLPALTCWPEDGGPFVTLPLVYTEHPGRPRTQPGDVPAARARRRLHRHALADRQGRRLPLRASPKPPGSRCRRR